MRFYATVRNMSIGNRIRAARQARGLTVAQLARACEVTENAVRLWERGEREPMFRSVEAVARATGQPLNYFTEEESGEPAADTAVHR